MQTYQDALGKWVLFDGVTKRNFDTQQEAMRAMVNMGHDESYISAVRAAATAILQILTVTAPGLGWQWNNEFGGASALPYESFMDNADIVKADIADGLAVLGLMTAWLAEDSRGAKLQKLRTE